MKGVEAQPFTCTVVFMPGDTTSTACGAKWKSLRKFVVVSPAANFCDAAIAAHSSKFVGMPFNCVRRHGSVREDPCRRISQHGEKKVRRSR